MANRNPIYLAIYAAQATDPAVHDPKCTTVTRSPRVYQGACACGWRGSKTTGGKALVEMKGHALRPAVTSHEGERG